MLSRYNETTTHVILDEGNNVVENLFFDFAIRCSTILYLLYTFLI